MKRYTSHLSISILLIALVSIFLKASPPHPRGTSSLLMADMAPALLVKLLPGDTASVPLGIADADIDIKVTGNIAVTTMSLNFYNDQDRNLEGQFIFPLAEGQAIHYFAMDVNGVMHEGAVVEKQKGREVFEKIERRRVDPGLLEWSKGNNFSARVFPIPSKGYKKIIVAFQQELQASGNAFIYNLPLGFKARVKHFGIKAMVSGDAAQPLPMDDNAYMLAFSKPATNWQSQVEYKNIIPDHAIQFQVPVESKTSPMYIEKVPGTADSYYFYALVKADEKSSPKQNPQKLGIIWDVSGSASERDRDKELDIIKQYVAKLKNVQVQVQTFSVKISERKEFNIAGGNTGELLEYLKGFEPDGATQLGCLDLSASDRDEILLFSDGVHTFGERNIRFPKCPIYTFSTGNGADYSMLQYISRSTNGKFISAAALKTEDILPQLMQTGFNFISSSAQGNISQVYPSIATSCSGYFGIAGIAEGRSGSLKLNFGPGNTISQSIAVNINGAQTTEKTIGRIWAQKKITELELQSEQNKEQITALGKQFSVITRYTSLIVLEGLEDYVQYGITPPDEKTKKEYDERVKQNKEENIKTTKTHADQVADDFKKVVSWWDTNYKPVYLNPTPKPAKRGGAALDSAGNHIYMDNDADGVADSISVHNSGVGNVRREETVSTEVLRSQNITSTGGSSTHVANPVTLEEESVPASGAASSPPAAYDEVSRLGYFDGRSGNANGDPESRNYRDVSNFTYAFVNAKKEGGDKGKSVNDIATLKGSMALKTWDSKEPYMAELKTASGDALYKKYLSVKSKYKDMPSFYIDVADYFEKANRHEEAIRIISNLAEIRPDDSRLMRVLAHRLQQWKENKLATSVFEEVLKMKPEEPQSYRDLGLAYAESREYQKAVDMLSKVVNGKWDSRFPEIEALTACEINYLASISKTKLNMDSLDKRLIKDMPIDIRVVIDWDADNCDIDLWVTDPSGEKCFYSHALTQAGGRISRDFTRGYGPEEFKLKKALPGKYKVEINYYGSSQLTLAGPTTIHAQMFTNYGKPNEQRKEIALRLATQKDVVYVGDFEFTK
jgi:tetratricopeptide (TPR) repeat protein